MTFAPSPEVPFKAAVVAPAPWTLHAEGYAFALKRAEGGLALALFVDYASSPVGPYRELLLIDRTVALAGRRLPTISKIYVSSQASVDNGRRNWGIPKELATFAIDQPREGVDRVTMHADGKLAVELAIQRGRLSLPVATWIIPPRVRTLGQELDGRSYEVTLRGRGRVHTASLLHAWSDGERFAKLAPERVVAVARVSKVNLTFPEALVR